MPPERPSLPRTPDGPPSTPRFGGALWRIVRLTNPVASRLAGKRWFPILALVEHRGRKTGRQYAAPVAGRRIADGFVVSLAFGSQVDWYLNLMANGGGTMRWHGHAYPISRPERIGASTALASFHPLQRFALRISGIDGYVRLGDLNPVDG